MRDDSCPGKNEISAASSQPCPAAGRLREKDNVIWHYWLFRLPLYPIPEIGQNS